jgi:hypothetical protein
MERPFRLERQRLKEKDVVAACLDLLAVRRWCCKRQQSGLVRTPDGRWMRLGEVGLPDYYVLHELFPGFYLEVKGPGCRLSKAQVDKIRELQIAYGLAICVVDSARDLRVWLDQHEHRFRQLKGESHAPIAPRTRVT